MAYEWRGINSLLPLSHPSPLPHSLLLFFPPSCGYHLSEQPERIIPVTETATFKPAKIISMGVAETTAVSKLYRSAIDAIITHQEELQEAIETEREDADDRTKRSVFVCAIAQTMAKAVVTYLDILSDGNIADDQLQQIMVYAAEMAVNSRDRTEATKPTAH
jgi:hypothetical protein